MPPAKQTKKATAPTPAKRRRGATPCPECGEPLGKADKLVAAQHYYEKHREMCDPNLVCTECQPPSAWDTTQGIAMHKARRHRGITWTNTSNGKGGTKPLTAPGVVGRYLDVLAEASAARNKEEVKPKHTRKWYEKKLAQLDEAINDATGVQRLLLVQRRRNIADEFNAIAIDASLEDQFVEVAHAWAKQRGIDYASFRELGVSHDVLVRAGFTSNEVLSTAATN